MSHQQTITVGFDNRYYNIPTVWEGKKVSNEEATNLAQQKLKQGGSFNNFATQDEAVASAGKVSESYGRTGNKKLATVTMPNGTTADIFGPENSSKEEVMAKAQAAKDQWTAGRPAASLKTKKTEATVPDAAPQEAKTDPETPYELLSSVNSFLKKSISEPAIALLDLGKTLITGALGTSAGGIVGGAGALLPGPENQAKDWYDATSDAVTMDIWTKEGERMARGAEERLNKMTIPPFWRGRLNTGKPNMVTLKEATTELDDAFFQAAGGLPWLATAFRTAVYGAPDTFLGRTPFKGTPALTTAKAIGERSTFIKTRFQEMADLAEKAGYKLSNDELPPSIVAVADAMAPERVAASNLDELAENVKLKKAEVKAAVNDLSERARSTKAMVEIKPIQEVVETTAKKLVDDGFDVAEMPILQRRLKDFENLVWVQKNGQATKVGFNELNILERRLTMELKGKKSGEFSAEDTAILRLRGAVRGHMDDIFNRGAITGDPEALAAWKAAKDKASYLNRFDEDRVIRNLVREDASPEQIYRWIVGASAMGATKQASTTVRRLKAILGDDHPSLVYLRNAVLRDILMPAFADTPNFKKLITNIDKLVLENPSLAKELAIPVDQLTQMKAAAHAAGKTRGPLPDWANRSWLTRSAASIMFGHQIARKGTIVRFAHKTIDALLKTGVITRKEIVNHLVEVNNTTPAVVPKSPLWADIMVRGAAADLSDMDDSEDQFE